MGGALRYGLPVIAGLAVTAQASPLDPPAPEAVAEGRQIVQEMKASPRGPYSRIRWYCNDGSVQPPVAYACSERGGGRQHAEYSPARARLAQLGWPAGTIYAATTVGELFDAGLRQERLRKLPLEQYLVDVDNGWVLAKARDYRGRVQVEDETAAGSRLLEDLLGRTAWARDNFLLVREIARTVPHGEDTGLARAVRRDAVGLAELEPSAERWRAEIHTSPSRDIAPRLAEWAGRQKRPDVRAFAMRLAADLDRLYGAAGRRTRIGEALAAVGASPAGQTWQRRVAAALESPPATSFAALCAALGDARATVFDALPPKRRIALIDAMAEIEASLQIIYQEHLADAALSRADLLRLGLAATDCAYGSGLLSARERQMLRQAVDAGAADSLHLAEYRGKVAALKRAPGWALGTVRHTFAEGLVTYTALEPKAARFSDDLLRGSPLWMLGDVLKKLTRDADRLAGSVSEIAGETGGAAIALNPGVARGTLRVFETLDEAEHAAMQATDIVVLPETLAELSRVAGILTLGEGNALSHVQLLARNFGIPNVAIDHAVLETLRPLEGQEVVLVASSNGDVLLRPVDDALREMLAPASAATADSPVRIDVPLPDLAVNRVLALPDIGRSLSGKVVGPKAANLGELNRLFPGRVAPAVAIPFGVYAAHLKAAGLDTRIADAFTRRNEGRLTAEEMDAELARIRREIANLEIDGRIRKQLESLMAEHFGEPGSYGVFVRSDTNVEDLPQFTGAGLNETVPHVVGLDAQLAAVPRVWGSVLSPRALAWRASVLENPARIYASVLLMKSVPSTKSGVLVTANLIDRSAPGLTASVAWGVGGAVAGEAAESLVILPQRTELVSESKSPYRRHLAATGGVGWLPAAPGQVLDDAEVEALRVLAAEVADKYEPVVDDSGVERPWDIEFGFIEGELTLFQIRPLVERSGRNADALLRRLLPLPDREPLADRPVALDELPRGEKGDS